MKPRLSGIVLALALGQGFLSGGLRGMEPGLAPVLTEPDAAGQPGIVTEAPAGFEATTIPDPVAAGKTPDQSHSKGRRQRGRKHHCWATHNSLGCGSLKAECTFIFGSCRSFYGEQCLKGPPPLPVPAGYPSAPQGCSNCP